MEENSIPRQKIRRKLAVKKPCDHQDLLLTFVLENIKKDLISDALIYTLLAKKSKSLSHRKN
jgi:hypothetical protein